MTDQKDAPKSDAKAEEPVTITTAAYVTDTGEAGAIGIAQQGRDAVLVAQFADMDAAKIAYGALRDAESKRAIDIEGVLVVNSDYQGKIKIQKMTDHTTRNGFVWGAVAGAVLGVIFPPSILVSAVGVGFAGAIAGKVGNVVKKSVLADELAEVLPPGSSGIVALVAVTAVDAVKQTIPDAKRVEAVPVDDETASAVKEAAKAAGDVPVGA